MWWPVVVPVWWCHVVARGARVGRLSGLVLVVSEERGKGKGGTQGVEWWCQCGARGGASVVPVLVVCQECYTHSYRKKRHNPHQPPQLCKKQS